MVNINKLRGKIVENSLTVEKLAELMKIDKSTLYRRINSNGDSFTIKEARIISEILKLNTQEVNEIFFNLKVA